MLLRKACFLLDERGIRVYYPAIHTERTHHIDSKWRDHHKRRSYKIGADDRVAATERIKTGRKRA